MGVRVSLRAATPRPLGAVSTRTPPSAAHGLRGPSSGRPQQRESTATVGFILGTALWMVLSIARPLDTGPALFWTWFLLGSCLPGAALLAAVARRLRGLDDMRASSFVVVGVLGGLLARGISLGCRQIITAAVPQFDHGFEGLFTDIVVNSGALVLVSLAILALLHRGRMAVRSAMFVAGGVGAVFSSLHLMTEQLAEIATGADLATLSVHIIEHAALLPVGYPLWAALLVGAIVRWRRETSHLALHQAVRITVFVVAAQAATVLLTEVVPGMLGGIGTQVTCLALAVLVGVALSSPWRGLISYAEDGPPRRSASRLVESRQSVPVFAADQSGGA